MVRFLLLAALAGTSSVALSNVAVNAAPDAAALADHLKASKVVYYGSWRCSACQYQGRLFGDAVNRLPYVECAKPEEFPIQAAACQTAEIRAYPTWILPNGDRRVGVQSLEELQRWSGMSPSP